MCPPVPPPDNKIFILGQTVLVYSPPLYFHRLIAQLRR